MLEYKLEASDKYRLSIGEVINNTITLDIACWCLPTDNCDTNYKRVINNLSKKVKQEIHNTIQIRCMPFKTNHSIVDFSIKCNGMKTTKKSYCNCSIVLFIDKPDCNHIQIKKLTEKILYNITNRILSKNEYLYFYKTK